MYEAHLKVTMRIYIYYLRKRSLFHLNAFRTRNWRIIPVPFIYIFARISHVVRSNRLAWSIFMCVRVCMYAESALSTTIVFNPEQIPKDTKNVILGCNNETLKNEEKQMKDSHCMLFY